MRCGPSCLWRGVCPRDIAMIAIAALDCALRRPRRRQPTTLPLAALWMAAPYHAVTRAARGKRLANPLPLLARRPLLPPVTTRFATSAPDRRPGSDRRHALPPPPSPRRRNHAHGASHRPRPSQGSARAARGHCLRAIGGGRGPSATRKDSASTSRSRPHGRSLASLHSLATRVRAAGVDRAGRLR